MDGPALSRTARIRRPVWFLAVGAATIIALASFARCSPHRTGPVSSGQPSGAAAAHPGANRSQPPSPDEPSVACLIDILCSASGTGRVEAARSLGRLGRDSIDALPFLLAAAGSQDPALKCAAIEAIGAIRDVPHNAVQEVARGLLHPDPAVRAVSASALGCFGFDASDYVPSLKALWKRDPDGRVREKAGEALYNIRGMFDNPQEFAPPKAKDL